MFLHLYTTKEPPCHVDSDWMPLKEIIGQTITHIAATNGFKMKSWWHDYTLNDTKSPCMNMVYETTSDTSVYAKLPCIAQSFLTPDMDRICGCASQTPQEHLWNFGGFISPRYWDLWDWWIMEYVDLFFYTNQMYLCTSIMYISELSATQGLVCSHQDNSDMLKS